MDTTLTITIESEARTELCVSDVEALILDLRKLGNPKSGNRSQRTSEHRVIVSTSRTRAVGLMRLRHDAEVNVVFVAVDVEGKDSFEFGFQDVGGVLAQLRRVRPSGPRLLRDVISDD